MFGLLGRVNMNLSGGFEGVRVCQISLARLQLRGAVAVGMKAPAAQRARGGLWPLPRVEVALLGGRQARCAMASRFAWCLARVIG